MHSKFKVSGLYNFYFIYLQFVIRQASFYLKKMLLQMSFGKGVTASLQPTGHDVCVWATKRICEPKETCPR